MQHISADGSIRSAVSATRWEIVMRLWKKIFEAYVASAALSGPFVISGFY